MVRDQHEEGQERRSSVLTEEDIRRIKEVTCNCPNGLSAETVFKIKEFICWLDRLKMFIGDLVIKVIVGIVLAFLAVIGYKNL